MTGAGSLAVSVVVISRNEAPRLRLTLASLGAQTAAPATFEVIVVDDASDDETPDVVHGARIARLEAIRNDRCRGRSASRNAGARVARGDLVVFVDGDTLCAPSFVDDHARGATGAPMVVARGRTMHLRCTRFFADPELGTPMPGQEARVARMGPERARSLVTMAQVTTDFGAIVARAEPGIYPGSGPRRSYEIDLAALAEQPPLSVSWMAVSGQNLALRRRDFEELGGFVDELALNEHRELALRACERGGRVVLVPATTYHLTHRVGIRDPLDDVAWEETFYRLHPTRATKLMRVFWASLAGHPAVPAAARIATLRELDDVVRGASPHDYDAIYRDLRAAAEHARAAVADPRASDE